MNGVRMGALVGAIGLYGLYSVTAPPAPGLAEGVIGVLLLGAVGPGRVLGFMTGALLLTPADPGHRVTRAVGCAAFQLLFWLPLLRGVALGWEARAVVRDLVPLGFLFLPVLLAGAAPEACRGLRAALAWALALAGVAFAVRWWIEVDWAVAAVGRLALPDGRAYLLNSPAVLFAALWLPSAALRWVVAPPYSGTGARGTGAALPRALVAGVLLGASALILAAFAGAVHRMALGLVALAALLGLATSARRLPARLLVPLLAGLPLLAALTWEPATGAFGLVQAKSEQVGLNQRAAEVEAVLTQIGRSPISLLAGDGWGALVANPAVGGWLVGYTHSFPSYLLLKTGLIGTLVMVAWLATLAPAAVRLVRRDLPLALAVLPPLADGLLLHTSFKFLCFGLLLALLALAGAPADGRCYSDLAGRNPA